MVLRSFPSQLFQIAFGWMADVWRVVRSLAISALLLGTHTAAVAATPPTILVFGDSLSAAYGIQRDLGWVNLLQKRVQQEGLPHRIVNASISGETTSGGLSRFRQAIDSTKPAIILIELGANDGLRGLPVNDMRNNLAAMIKAAKDAGAKPVLIGMMIPPNYGPRYTQSFNSAFADLSKEHQLPLVPFLLEGVAGKAELNQDDGLHPLAEAQPQLLNNVWPILKPMLQPAR